MKMKERMQRFMIGRYGADELTRFLMIVSMILMVLDLFFRTYIFFALALAVMVYAYFRMFSRNTEKRYKERIAYLKIQSKVVYFFAGIKNRWKDRRVNHIYKCPSCRQKIRIPKGKGRIEITCPKCGQRFIKRS